MTTIIDGNQLAATKLTQLQARVGELGRKIRLFSWYFPADANSVLYTEKKRVAAGTVGIEFVGLGRELALAPTVLVAEIQAAAADKSVSGIMVQKPSKKSYNEYFLSKGQTPPLEFGHWWQQLTSAIPMTKDVDGLAPNTKVLGATARAVLACLGDFDLSGKQILIIGKSDLAGLPLARLWRAQNRAVTLVGSKELAQMVTKPAQLTNYDLIVSATGHPKLITGDMIKDGAALVDVGEPLGDLDFVSCRAKASLITPVPGGVGPLTVISLLENAYQLALAS